MSESYYEILGVEPDASAEEIKAAYRLLVKTTHPDAGGDPEAFHQLSMAYNILSDVEERRLYDLVGKPRPDNAMAKQERVLQHMADLFELSILAVDRPVEEVDMIGLMKQAAKAKLEQLRDEERSIERLLKSSQTLRNRIKVKGETKNRFAEIIDGKAKIYAEQLKLASQIANDIQRVVEELERYSSIVDVIRTVQAAFYPVRDRRSSFITFIDYPS